MSAVEARIQAAGLGSQHCAKVLHKRDGFSRLGGWMQIEPLQLRSMRKLLLDEQSGLTHLSAASGLWISKNRLYVVADDELVLGVFSLLDHRPGHAVSIISGSLPTDAKLRKAAKPDFESLTCLPASVEYPYAALLALGSGSTEQRKRGVVWPFDQLEQLAQQPQLFDLHALYRPLEKVFVDLNIEGVVIHNNCLKLWQRANNQQRKNAVIEYDLADLYALIDAQSDALIIEPRRIDYYDLGEVAGVPLTFTDAYALEDGACVFTAAAENTDNSYLDGECVAAAIGLIDAQRQLRWIRPVEPILKLEGVSVQQQGEQLQIYLVSDADDPSVAAQLFEAQARYSI